jgi:hypothetical protein
MPLFNKNNYEIMKSRYFHIEAAKIHAGRTRLMLVSYKNRFSLIQPGVPHSTLVMGYAGHSQSIHIRLTLYTYKTPISALAKVTQCVCQT